MKQYENIVALSEENGVSRWRLYEWRDRLDAVHGDDPQPPENPRESIRQKENS
jgi:hypothetical protein